MFAPLPLVISLMFSLLTGCACFDPFCICSDSGSSGGYDVPSAPDASLPPPVLAVHAEEVTRIVQEMAAELKHARHLHLEDSNTYFNEEGIHTIQLTFISQDILELCPARMLIVDMVETLLAKLNSNPLLAPEFTNQGFFPHNLEIYINFESYYIKYVDPFYIKWICMEDGKITFYTADADDTDKMSWHSRKESFYTSRDIVYYERKGEQTYKDTHERARTIFGNKRFFPNEP